MKLQSDPPLRQPALGQADVISVQAEPLLPDMASRRSRLFYRHTISLMLSRIWLPLLLACLLGFVGMLAGYSSHTRSYQKTFSVNMGLPPGNMHSGREVAVTARAILDDSFFYERVWAMQDNDLRLGDCVSAISLTVPAETDIVRFTVTADQPETVRQLAEASKIVAHAVLESMPQVAAIDWNDGQTEVQDLSGSRSRRVLLYAFLYAALGGLVGLVLVFLSILLDTRIHFVDEADFTEDARSLIFAPAHPRQNKVRYELAGDTRAKAGAGNDAKRAGETAPSPNGRGKTPPMQRQPFVAVRKLPPQIHASAMLFAAQILQQVDRVRSEDERRGVSLLLLPCDDIRHYRRVIPLVASAFRFMEEEVQVLDFTDEALFCDRSRYLLPDITLRWAGSSSPLGLGGRVADYANSVGHCDITIVAFPDLCASPDTLTFQAQCDMTVLLASLHRSRMSRLRKTINHLAYLNKPVDGIAYVCKRERDLRRNLL